MNVAATIRLQIETHLANRIPSALTPRPRFSRQVEATGIEEIDSALEGGLPLGALTEIVGPESSGRTSVALSFVARLTRSGRICAWIDVSDMLHPESAASLGADVDRLLWVRCGVQNITVPQVSREGSYSGASAKPWSRIDKALRATDLLLQAGGFSAVVLDMASIAPEYVSRVPLATWFRYRAAAERTQASFLLLTQYPCAKSSREWLLRFYSSDISSNEVTILTEIEHRLEIIRQRYKQNYLAASLNKSVQNASITKWRSQSTWAGAR